VGRHCRESGNPGRRWTLAYAGVTTKDVGPSRRGDRGLWPRQERSAQSEDNPANLKELPWRRLPRQSPPVTALNRCAAADGCRDRPLLAVILQEGNARPLSRGRPPPPDQTPLTLLSCNGISRYKPRCFATAAPVSSGSILSRHGATTQAAEISAPWQWCGVNEYSLMSAAQPMCRCSFTIDRVRLSLDSKAPI